MKLRINGNSIRLRLSKPEVEKLSVDAYLEEHTSFGSNTFVYALQSKDSGKELFAEFVDGKITVFISRVLIKDWAVNDVIGFNATMRVNDAESLHILLE